MKFDPKFKEAISALSSKDKDKLIFRLLKHDLMLANQLYFELLSEESVPERRIKMEKRVRIDVERMTRIYYSPGCLLMDIRYLSGEINEHVKITHDKYGEVSLNILMINEVLQRNKNHLNQAKANDAILYIFML